MPYKLLSHLLFSACLLNRSRTFLVRAFLTFVFTSLALDSSAQTFPGPVSSPTTTAIPHNSPTFVGWATGIADFQRGWVDIRNPSLGVVGYGSAADALGPAGTSTTLGVVSLGDGGRITLTFDYPITDGPGFDLAVFENSFNNTFLELAFVEVSSDGLHFFRFPAISNTQTTTQVGGFGSLDTTYINNLAGKYRVGFGTPFDLAELSGNPLLNIFAVTHVRIIDVVGSIDPAFGTRDSLGNLINDPFPTPFNSGGFDLDAVGVIHAIPEPIFGAHVLGLLTLACFLMRRRV